MADSDTNEALRLLIERRDRLDRAIEAGMRSFTSAYDTDEPRRLMRKFLDRKRL